MIKNKIYKNILARRSGVDYSPIIRFETIIFNMDEAKALTTTNQPEKSNQKQQKRGQKIGLGGGAISSQSKEGRIRCSIRGRGEIYGDRGCCGG